MTAAPAAPAVDEEAYRDFAREWLAQHLRRRGPDTMPDGRRSGESDHQFAARSRTIQSTLFKGGYAGISLPVEVGGQGLPGRYQAIFDQEARDYELPGVFGGTFGPVLATRHTARSAPC
jgi:alkylation response protein AidB-like acyl-CoA dehydrogenase